MLAFNLTLMAAILSPGPAMLVAIQTTLTSGRMAGIFCGIGLGLMASIWTLLALMGLDAIFQLVPWAYVAAKILGAGYLLFIAWNIWRDARNNIEAKPKPARNALLQGFIVNAVNPKSVLFAAAVLIVIFPAGMSAQENVLIVINHFTLEVISYTALAFIMSTRAVRDKYLKAKFYFDRTASVVLGALGIRLLFNR